MQEVYCLFGTIYAIKEGQNKDRQDFSSVDMPDHQPLTRRRAAPQPHPRTRPLGGGLANGRTPLLFVLACLFSLAIGAQIMRLRSARREREVVLAVNGVMITKDRFYQRLEQEAGAQVMRTLIDEELTLQFARSKGLLPTEQEIERHYAEMSQEKTFVQNLARSGLTPDASKRMLRLNMAQAAVLNQGVTVSDAEVFAYYRQNSNPLNPAARFYIPELIQIAVIVNSSDKEIRRASQDLNRNISWETVVATYSKDKSKLNAGLLPYLPKGRTASNKIPGMEATLFSMNVGETRGPVRLGGTWWIVRCRDKRRAETLSFQQVKEECRTAALLKKGIPANAPKQQQEFVSFRHNAAIKAFWKQYEEVAKAP